MKLQSLFSWSLREFSHLPWRQERSLYRTLVSEIMLQQTTVGTVKNHYERFLKRFPSLESLAQASEDELTVAWKGLGYYRRARNLKKIAEKLAADYDGKFPANLEELQMIPGIGPYTANALVGIGMDQRALAVDANLERVIARLFGIETPKGPKLQKEIQKRFEEKKIFHQKLSFRSLNEALMDLGRTICQARRATCEICPLNKDCVSFQNGNPLKFPVMKDEKTKPSQEHELHLLRVVVRKKDKILVYKKSDKEWLSGQYEVPTFILSTTDKKLKQYPILKSKISASFSFKTGITKYKILNSVAILSEKDFKSLAFTAKPEWLPVSCENSNFSTATLKLLSKLNS